MPYDCVEIECAHEVLSDYCAIVRFIVHSSGMTMSSREICLLVDRQGSIAFTSLTVLFMVNVPAAMLKVFGVLSWVGRSNILASFQMPLSVQHWSGR